MNRWKKPTKGEPATEEDKELYEREFRKLIANHYLQAAETHSLRDHEYVAIPVLLKTDTGHPPNGAHLKCYLNPINEEEEMNQLEVLHAAVNAYRM